MPVRRVAKRASPMRRLRRHTCRLEQLETRRLLAGDLVGHWRAEDLRGTIEDQAEVDVWPDAIAQIPAASLRGSPTLVTGQWSGRSVVRFDASDANGLDSLKIRITDNPINKAEDFTVVVVFASSSSLLQGETGDWFRGTGLVDADNLGFGYDWGLVLNQDGQVGAGLGNGLGQPTTNVYSTVTGLNDGQLHIAALQRQGSTISLYVDDLPPVTGTDANGAPRSNTDIAFGQLLSGGGGYTGDLAEIRLFDGALDETQWHQVREELVTYYNNLAPTALDDEYSVVEDAIFLIVSDSNGLLQNDTDPEGDPLSAAVVESTQHGTLNLNPDGSFVYDPDPNFFGEDRFTYVALDPQASDPATVTIIVEPQYDPALAVADTYKTLAGQVLSVNEQEGVLVNDLNPDQVPLTAELVDDAANGLLTLHPSGAFEYDPQDFSGQTSFTYRILDGQGASAPQTVTLIVNTPPQAVDDEYSVAEDSELLVDAANGVQRNDLDAESNPMTAMIVELPEHGELTFQEDGSFEYRPNPNFFGQDSFTYQLSDTIDLSQRAATVLLNIESVNDPPIGRGDLYTTFAGQPLEVTSEAGVLTNDFDIDSPTITARQLTSPRHGTLTLEASGGFTYLPTDGFIGTDDFRYEVSDGQLPSAPVAVTVVVADPSEQIVINEVHYDPPDNTIPAEFIELFHLGFEPIDLSNWYFSSGISYVIPTGTVLQPGEYLVLAQDPETIQQAFTIDSLGPWTGRLSSDGEDIELRDATGRRVDLVDYRQGFPWPVAAGGEGPSLELIHPALDNSLGGSWRSSLAPTPGAPNSVSAANAPPQIRQVSHSPQQPASGETTTVTAKVTDPNGVAAVELHYQVVLPGAFLPALLPLPLRDLRRNPDMPRTVNPEYTDPANWTTIVMVDDGTGGDLLAADGVYTAVLPGQQHRTLMRYRITVRDTLEDAVTVPYAEDESRNFAYFVYDGVPDYNGHSAETLQTIPVYHLIARADDVSEMMAYNSSDQITQGTQARFAYNWPAAFVYDGIVYDNINMRLRGANGRYHLRGKRSMRFRFNDGEYFQAHNQDGETFPQQWRTLTTGKMFDNRQTMTYSLNEAVNMYLFNQIGVPAADTLWVHFRVIDGAEEVPDQWHGDFWGFNFVVETYDIRFLDHQGLEHGNLYKLINQTRDPLQQQRYQAPYAVSDGSDHNEIERYLRGMSTAEYIDAHVKLEEWYLYHSLSEAIRHYDMWPDANKNMVYYFEPDYQPENDNLGKLWILPWDTDASWGPTWNNGHDVVYNSIFPASGGGGDSQSTPELWPAYYNTVREIRDLLWQPDQMNPLVEQFAAILKPMEQADLDRWRSAPSSAGSYAGLSGQGIRGIDALVQDMQNFAFVGGNWPGGGIGPGGRAVHLDRLQGSRGEEDELPATPTIAYVGTESFPADGLRFRTSTFADPQGNDTFQAMEWRVAEITDPAAPSFDPTEKLKLEWNASWESGELTDFDHEIAPPAAAVQAGHSYRARVRMKDNSGRWSHWSEPLQFTATAANTSPLINGLRISEIHYHPANPSVEEINAGFNEDNDFEFLELVNVSDQTLDLTGAELVRVDVEGQTQGVDFSFSTGEIRQLLPGEYVLVVEDREAFQFRYGSDLPIAGQWQGGLGNGGEQITLMGDGFLVQQFSYLDRWYRATDGNGPSLELVAPYPNEASLWGQATSWRASVLPGGSPGTAGDVQIPGDANGDGLFNSSDMVAVFQAGEYEDDVANNSTYEEGDWNGDGEFDSQDMVLAFQAGYYELDAPNAVFARADRRSLSSTEQRLLDRDRFFERLAEDDSRFDLML